MDKTNVIVWLLSSVSLILWWSIVNHDVVEKWKESFLAFFRNARNLEWLSEVLSHLAFYGSTIGGVIGFEKDSISVYFFSGYWFLAFLAFSLNAMKKAESIEMLGIDENSEPNKGREDV